MLNSVKGFRLQSAACFRHDQRRADGMPGDVGDDDIDGVWSAKIIEIVSAHMTGRLAVSRDESAIDLQR